MTARLIDCLATTEPLAEVFSDESVLQRMLDFEIALAHAAAAAGAIPDGAARTIAAVAHDGEFDVAAIASDARLNATPSMALVKALRQQVHDRDPSSAQYVHWGATSQDVSDTALLLLLRRAQPLLARDHDRLVAALRVLSDGHAATAMLGRTLLQPAAPITFGLKAAGWHAAANRGWRRVEERLQDALRIQLGGATGTRAALGPHADQIARRLAEALGLLASPPWHTHRDRLGALVCACGVYVATLGKIARDVALLMQFEVGEASERGGGSSTMPQKQNPAGSAIVIAAATRMPGLVASFLAGMLQEHERSVGGGQAEWATVATVIQTTGAAVDALAGAIEGLSVDSTRMLANLTATRGTVFAERAVSLLAGHVGHETAHALVITAVRRSRESGMTLAAALQSMPEVSNVLTADVMAGIEDPQHYLGDAERLRRELLADGKS